MKYYLHDLARANPEVPDESRFTVSTEREPYHTVIFKASTQGAIESTIKYLKKAFKKDVKKEKTK